MPVADAAVDDPCPESSAGLKGAGEHKGESLRQPLPRCGARVAPEIVARPVLDGRTAQASSYRVARDALQPTGQQTIRHDRQRVRQTAHPCSGADVTPRWDCAGKKSRSAHKPTPSRMPAGASSDLSAVRVAHVAPPATMRQHFVVSLDSSNRNQAVPGGYKRARRAVAFDGVQVVVVRHARCALSG